MAAATNEEKDLMIFYVEDIEANQLQDAINTIKPNFCSSIYQFVGMRKSPAINRAIADAAYFLIFLSHRLLEVDLLWIDTILKQEDIEHRLAIVLYGMTMEEFQFLPHENLKRFDNRVIVKPNTINSSENLWNKVAKDVITMLLGNSGTSINGSSTAINITHQPVPISRRDRRVFIYHENRDLSVAKKIVEAIPKEYYRMWRGRHFVVGKPKSWNFTKFIQSSRKTFVILNSDYKDILNRFRQSFESSNVHVSRITFISLDNVNINNPDDISYIEVFGKLIKLCPDIMITDAIQEDLKTAILKAQIRL